MAVRTDDSTPGRKLAWAILIGLVLAIPLFSVWLLVYDRQSQSRAASESITAGWGGRQQLAGPQIVIPYRAPNRNWWPLPRAQARSRAPARFARNCRSRRSGW